MTLDDTPLADRIGEAIRSDLPLDGWMDVQARASRGARAARKRRAFGVGRTVLIAAALVLVGGSLAFALGDQVVAALTSGPVAPPGQLEMLSPSGPEPELVGAPAWLQRVQPGRVIAGTRRLEISLDAPHFGRVQLYSARTARGYCEVMVRDRRASGECRSDLVRSSSPVVFGWDLAHGDPTSALVDGRAYSSAARSLRIDFRHGGSRTVALTDRFFVFELGPPHSPGSGDPAVRFDVLDASGRAIGSRQDPFRLDRSPLRTRPIAGTLQRRVRVRLQNGSGYASLWTGRDRDGATCAFAGTLPPATASAVYVPWICGRDVGRSGHVVDDGTPLTFHRVPVSWTLGGSGNLVHGSFVFAYGWVAPGVTRLQLSFQDGSTARVPLRGHYFLYVIRPARWSPGHRPSVLRAFRIGGSVYRQFLYPRQPCLYPELWAACSPQGNTKGHGLINLAAPRSAHAIPGP